MKYLHSSQPIPETNLDFVHSVGPAVTHGDHKPTVEVTFNKDGTNTCTLISRDGTRHVRQGGDQVVFDALLEAQMSAIWAGTMFEMFALRKRVRELEAADTKRA